MWIKIGIKKVYLKILVIEDDKKTASYLERGLTENGFVVDVCHNGEDGLHQAKTVEYDLIVLDVMLPKQDGWSVISELRRSGKETLTLFLTAKDDVLDRVKGLDLGADAYLVKPFAFSELIAQIRTLFRRSPSRQPSVIQIADLEIDFLQHRANRGGKRMDLTPKEFALLVFLARRTGEILSRTLIADQVCNMHFDSDTNVVDVHIRRLRSKVDDPFPKKLIHTVRGMGYILRNEEN